MLSALASGIVFSKSIFPALPKLTVKPAGVLNLSLYTFVKFNSFWSQCVLKSKQVKRGKTPSEGSLLPCEKLNLCAARNSNFAEVEIGAWRSSCYVVIK